MILWASRKQPIIYLASAEEDYVETTLAAYDEIWLRRLLVDLTHEEEESTPIFYDNNYSMTL